jgi:hypothetical protein
MRAFFACSLLMLFVVLMTPMTVSAQDEARVFALPDATAGVIYRADIIDELRGRYRMRLDSGTQGSVFQWTLIAGELPSGLTWHPDGTLLGTPQIHTEQLFRLSFDVTDTVSHSEALTLQFTLRVRAPKLRLTKINDLRLVPVSANVPQQADSASQHDPETKDTGSSAGYPKDASAVKVASAPDGSPQSLRWAGGEHDYSEGQKSLAVVVEQSSQICLLDTLVLRKNQAGPDTQLVDHQPKKVDYNKEKQSLQVRLAPGENHILVTGYARKNAGQSCEADTDLNTLVASERLDLSVPCSGENCGKAPKADESDSPLSNRNMRAILGIEQSGASSAASAQNPFLDFFFKAQLTKNRWLAWGDVRVGTTPQQVAAFASSATNAVGAATADKINDLATSFDFKIGPEFQLNPDANTRVSLIAGFGAISSLTGPPKSAAIFKLPVNSSVQYANFLEQYPEAKTPGAAYITFVPHEQDRFFRQYFAGLRVRSYHGDSFPSMFDVTFGQNSAVTGGLLRHFVLGFDGSHQLPIRGGAVYIFGSATLKVGGPKFKSTPFVLDPAEASVKMSDPGVLITSRQSNRDFYRIGFGIDLVRLFKDSKKAN